MSNLLPSRSLFGALSRWPSVWDDEDLLNLPSVDRGIDLYENENEVVVKANVAGVSGDDIDVTYEKGVLWIKAESQKEAEDEKNKYYSRSAWSYSYMIAVPGMLDHTKEPEVTLDGGVLKVIFTKAEASKPKKLTVRSSKSD